MTPVLSKPVEEITQLLDNPRSGLKQSSDTNKTKYAILAIVEELQAQAREETLKILDQAELEKWFDMPDTLDNWKTWKRIRNTIADSLASAKGEHDKT